ncbi:MAG: hypothetical protein WCW84_09970 [Sulfurimonas sp.]|jgi:hypothetical protein
MLALQIDNQELERTLFSQFKTPEKIKEYFYALITEDLENRTFANILQESEKKDYVPKEEIFKALDSIA